MDDLEAQYYYEMSRAMEYQEVMLEVKDITSQKDFEAVIRRYPSFFEELEDDIELQMYLTEASKKTLRDTLQEIREENEQLQ